MMKERMGGICWGVIEKGVNEGEFARRLSFLFGPPQWKQSEKVSLFALNHEVFMSQRVC